MANSPKKIQDPTEAALSAIQEALSIRTTDAPARPAESAAPVDTSSDPLSTAAGVTAPIAEERLESMVAAEPPPVVRRAANDDRQSIGQILQSLQHRPPRTSYLIATLFALAWVAGCTVLVGVYLPDLQSVLGQGGAGGAVLVGLAALVLAPIAFFYVLAHMVWRSQELRLIAQSMARVAMRLAEPEEVARESIVSVGQAIRREVAAMGDGVERALARAAELETLVANEVAQLERTYHDNEVRIRSVVDNLINQRDNLVVQAEQIRNALSNIHLDLTRDINSTTDLVANRIAESAQKISQALQEKGEHITLALDRAGESMIGTLSERGGDLLERLERTSQQTAHAIATASEQLSASLNLKTDNVSQEFSQLAADLTEMLQKRLAGVTDAFAEKSSTIVQMMEERSRQVTENLVDTSSRLAETIIARADEVNNSLKSAGDSLVLDLSLRGEDLVSRISQTGAEITNSIDERAGRVIETFRSNTEQLVNVLGARSDAVNEMLTARLHSFDELMTRTGTELTEKIERDTAALGNLITRHLVEFDRTVKTYGTELVDRLGQRTQEVSDAMHTYVEGFDSKVASKTSEVAATLDQRLTRFQEVFDGRAQSLNEAFAARVADIAAALSEGGRQVVTALDRRVADATTALDAQSTRLAETIGRRIEQIDQTLGTRAAEVADNLDARIGRLEQLLIGRAESVAGQIETHSKAAADMLGVRSEQIAHAIKSNSAEAERVLTALSAGVNNTLRQSAADVQRLLVGVSNDVARNLVGKADEISSAISQRAAEMTRLLDERSDGLVTALGNKSRELTAEVSRVSEYTIRAIDAQGVSLARALMDNSEQIARMINEASENASGTVNRTLKSLQESTQAAIEQSKQVAAASVSEIMETNNILRADTTTLFERLREANALLQEVLSGAHQNMSTVENALASRVSEFVVTMNELTSRSGVASSQIEERIASFHNVTSKVLSDLSQLATQFESHGQKLIDAVSQIDAGNRRTETTLADRRAALEALVTAIDSRTEDLEQRLRRFSGMLEEALSGASNQAREIARLVAETSRTSAQTISQQFEIVRSISEEERQRASETIRNVHERTARETRSLFDDTIQSFNETLQGLKQMAAEVQRELETTRAELRRGIFELPQETAENAAQMRRVIVDQIDALAELNRIIARHGRALDVAEPRRPLRDEPSFIPATPSRLDPPVTSRLDAAPLRPAPRPDFFGGLPPSPRRESPSLNPGNGGSREGWLSDLLQRASRPTEPPPEERPARHTLESLDSLSVDIARMIDHEAATELWDRYKRGERNVFTRRLYTLQGQKAFDDIRRKYQSDREFRQTVDRYIAEFERLLEEISRDDHGQVVARTYLTSETGKVYTMLAHAAGRFGD
ncbi:MAG TPA: hypothetical protein VNL39_07260 [Xanthobacteraceae bacterium]|nr:hypothetical protein [Xanthobacteraceae bacterium]